ncbi:MAG TPA: sugar transferase [Planctomycetota bacterium]|nr:sugar transferase [Planctomycetota bacterium]
MNYSTGDSTSGGKARWVHHEKDGPVDVFRCHTPSSYSRGTLGRMWAFFGFTLSASWAALRVRRPDVVIATSPPLTTAIPGWIAARFRGDSIPLVFEVRDLWPESAVTTGVLRADSTLVRWLYRLEAWAYDTADRINVLTPAFREDLLKREMAHSDQIVFIPNGADLDRFVPGSRDNDARRELGWGERIVALYAGAHGRANALGQLIDTAERLRDRPDILIACVGDGPERKALESEALRRGLANLRFHGPKPKERMPAIVQACDIGLAVLQDNPTFRAVYPNKVFDYMACARPTVLAIDGVARELVCDQAQAGLFAQPENAASIADAIRELADDAAKRDALGKHGFGWVAANAGRESLADRYAAVLTGIKRPRRRTPWGYRIAKRVFDLLVAMTLLVALSPFLLVLSVLVRLSMGSPVFFRQERLGLGGRRFRILKFRTMREGKGPDSERLTGLGRWLRSTSLDELPELWNVLSGEMSLVGPRPLLPQYRNRYTFDQFRRHDVPPGVTGWAQVNGRNAISWEEKFALDLWYVERASFIVDLWILMRTLGAVGSGRGISASGEATMPEFMGSGKPG